MSEAFFIVTNESGKQTKIAGKQYSLLGNEHCLVLNVYTDEFNSKLYIWNKDNQELSVNSRPGTPIEKANFNREFAAFFNHYQGKNLNVIRSK